MARYRKKPIVVDAVQWNGDNEEEVAAFSPAWQQRLTDAAPALVWIAKSQTWGAINVGDYLIAESDGSGVYPCAGEVFETTYEPIDDDRGHM